MSGLDSVRRDNETARAGADALEARVVALRNHMLAVWAAELMGLSDPDAYARAVSASAAGHPKEEDVLRKISHDLADSGVKEAAEVRARMDEFLAQARMQLAGEARR